MKNFFKDLKKHHNSGIAIMMVTSAVAILSVLLADFTFETKLNKIRVENSVDAYQAKLNAEAGVRFALAKLKIYKEAWNLLENNTGVAGNISPQDAEQVVVQPFIYPIPLGDSANVIQKNALKEFEENNLLVGGLAVSMSALTGFINPNTLRFFKPPVQTQQEQDQDFDRDRFDRDDEDEENGPTKTPYEFMEKTFIETMKRALEEKIEQDEEFAALYSNVNVELLVKEVKYYVSERGSYDEPENADIEKLYVEKEITPKHAPMTSIDEMYQLAGWDDNLVNLIKDRLSIHQVSVINVNEITSNQLRVLFPEITLYQIEEFFKYRDGDPELETEPNEFKSADDFKKVITGQLAIVESSDYDKRIKEFKDAKIYLGVAGKVFKVVSEGSFVNSKYQITAYIDLPIKPEAPKPPKKNNNGQRPRTDEQKDDQLDQQRQDGSLANGQQQERQDDKDKNEKTKIILLDPRIVELRFQ